MSCAGRLCGNAQIPDMATVNPAHALGLTNTSAIGVSSVADRFSGQSYEEIARLPAAGLQDARRWRAS